MNNIYCEQQFLRVCSSQADNVKVVLLENTHLLEFLSSICLGLAALKSRCERLLFNIIQVCTVTRSNVT